MPSNHNFSFTMFRNATANYIPSSTARECKFLSTRAIKKKKKSFKKCWIFLLGEILSALKSVGTLPSPLVEPGFHLSAENFDLLIHNARSLENFSPKHDI